MNHTKYLWFLKKSALTEPESQLVSARKGEGKPTLVNIVFGKYGKTYGLTFVHINYGHFRMNFPGRQKLYTDT
jgi:hypothetical protein